MHSSTDAMFDAVYERLKAMAARHRASHEAQTINTTELVHETYLRMSHAGSAQFESPAQFFAYAARAMRHILLDAARERASFKAGSGHKRLGMSDPVVGAVCLDPMLALELDAGLTALEQSDARAAQVVQLHYFAGLPMDQVAEVLGIGERTAHRDWRYARAFLTDYVQA